MPLILNLNYFCLSVHKISCFFLFLPYHKLFLLGESVHSEGYVVCLALLSVWNPVISWFSLILFCSVLLSLVSVFIFLETLSWMACHCLPLKSTLFFSFFISNIFFQNIWFKPEFFSSHLYLSSNGPLPWISITRLQKCSLVHYRWFTQRKNRKNK